MEVFSAFVRFFVKDDASGEFSKIESGAKDAAREMDKAADGGGKLSNAIGKIGGASKVGVAGLAAIGGAAVGAVGRIMALASNSQELVEQQNKLATAFEAAGGTADQAKGVYGDFYALLGESDTATEAAQNLARLTTNQKELEKWSDTAAGAMAQFGDALPIENLVEGAQETAKTATVTGGLADAINWSTASVEQWSTALGSNQVAQDAFNAAIQSGATNEDAFNAALAACNSEQERSQLITETMNNLYGEAGQKYKELNADVMAARDAQNKFDQAMAHVGQALMPFSTAIMNLGTSFMTGLVPFAQQAGDALQGMLEGKPEAATEFATAISGMLTNIVQGFTDALPMMLNVGLQIVQGLITGIVTALPSLITGILGMLPQLITTFMQLATMIVTQLPTIIMTLLPAIVQAIVGAAQAFITALPQFITALQSMIQQLVAYLPTLIPLMIQGALQLFMAIVTALPQIIPQLLSAGLAVIMQIVQMLPTLIPQLLQAALTLFKAIVTALPQIIGDLLGALAQVIGQVISNIPSFLGSLLSAAVSLFMGIAQAVPQVVGSVLGAVGDLVGQIPGKITGFVGDIVSAGGNLIMGMVDGIRDKAGEIFDAAVNAVKGAIDGVKNFLGIHSPSRLMRDMFRYVPEGMAVGIEAEADAPLKSLLDVGEEMSKASAKIGAEVSGNYTASAQSVASAENIRRTGKDDRDAGANAGSKYNASITINTGETDESKLARMITREQRRQAYALGLI